MLVDSPFNKLLEKIKIAAGKSHARVLSEPGNIYAVKERKKDSIVFSIVFTATKLQ